MWTDFGEEQFFLYHLSLREFSISLDTCEVRSEDNTMLVTFSTDAWDNAFPGFLATYRAADTNNSLHYDLSSK